VSDGFDGVLVRHINYERLGAWAGVTESVNVLWFHVAVFKGGVFQRFQEISSSLQVRKVYVDSSVVLRLFKWLGLNGFLDSSLIVMQVLLATLIRTWIMVGKSSGAWTQRIVEGIGGIFIMVV